MAMYRCMSGGGGGVNLLDLYTESGYLKFFYWNDNQMKSYKRDITTYPANASISANMHGACFVSAADLKALWQNSRLLYIQSYISTGSSRPIWKIKKDGTGWGEIANAMSNVYLTSEIVTALDDDDLVIIPFATGSYSATISVMNY